jgi:hypothetical protein
MLQKRLLGQEFQSAAVVACADHPQVTIALQNLISGHHRSSAPRQTRELFPTG